MADALNKSDSLLVPPLSDDTSLRTLATLMARLQQIDLTPLLVYDIGGTVASALPALGEQFHIMGNEGWIFSENDEQKRDLIQRAIELHRYKGTPWAVEESIRLFDYDVHLIEWFDYGADPYLFCVDVNLYDQAWGQRVWDVVYGLIFRWKNARSHLERLRVYRVTKAPVHIATAIAIGETITVYPYTPAAIELRSTPCLSGVQQLIERLTVWPFTATEYTLPPSIMFNAALVVDDEIKLT